MRLFRLLTQIAALHLTFAIFISALSGIASIGVIICVLESIRSGHVSWWEFASIAAFALVVGRTSRVLLGQLVGKSVIRLRRRLVRSVLRMPLLDLERIGTTRLMVAFTTDLVRVAAAIRNLASVFANGAFLVALLTYIGWLSLPIVGVTASLCAVSIAGAVVFRRLEQRHRRSGRDAWDKILETYATVLDGIKELKLNRPLARRILLTFEDSVRDFRQSAGARARYSDVVGAWIQGMFYLMLGLSVFSSFGIGHQLRMEFGLLALLHIRRPLLSVVVDSKAFSDASVALRRITEIGLTIADDDRDPESVQPSSNWPRNWRHIKLRGVEFRYGTGDGDFVLGPLEITLRRGKLIFVAGANSSGKTTFIKLLTGLYTPTSGTILHDGDVVDDENLRWYRNRFAAVFSDFTLFDNIVDTQHETIEPEAEQLAIRLKLERWLFSSAEERAKAPPLSSSDRRRAALLLALLGDRPVFVFDAWAIDQDSHFKDMFYLEILPRLRDLGKLVVVVSYDEQYFATADRVLWLARGEPPTWRAPSSFGAMELIEDRRSRG